MPPKKQPTTKALNLKSSVIIEVIDDQPTLPQIDSFSAAAATPSSSAHGASSSNQVISFSLRNPSFAEFSRYTLATKAPLQSPLWSLSILTPAALCSMWMYIAPSWKYGMNAGGLLMAILQTIGNPFGAAFAIYNIGGHYINLFKTSRDALQYLHTHGLIDREAFDKTDNCLERCLHIFERGGKNVLRKLHDAKLDILTISVLICCTYAATALFYKDTEAEPAWLLWSKAAITLAVNSLTHTLPVSLILNVPWLNTLLIQVPLFPLILSRNIYLSYTRSPEEQIQDDQKQQLTKRQKALHAQVTNTFYGLITNVKQNGLVRRGCTWSPRIPTEIAHLLKLPQEQDIQSLLSLLPTIAKHYSPLATSAVAASSSYSYSTLWSCLGYLNSGLGKIFGATGAVLVGGCLSGYIKVNYDILYDWLGENAFGAALLVTPTAVASEVLCLYFGWLAFTGAYDFASHWLTCRPKVPYAFKLNPLLSSFFLITTWFLNCFSYGTALQLVHDTFDPEKCGKILYTFLEIAAKYGIIVYGCINFAQLVEKLVEPIAKWRCCSSEEKQQYLFLLDTLKRRAALIDELKPELLQEILNTIDDPILLATLGLAKSAPATDGTTVTIVAPPHPDADAAATSSAGARIKSQSWGEWFGGFFASQQKDDVEWRPLLAPSLPK